MSDLDFTDLEASELLESEAAALAMLKATLAFPVTDVTVKGAKLAADLRFCYEEPTLDPASLWFLVLDVASCIPHNHPAQASLLSAIDQLRTSEETTSVKAADLRTLPELGMSVRKKYDEIEYEGADTPEREVNAFKNLVSFIARLTTPGVANWILVPFAEMRATLESPPVTDYRMNRRVWVATEWLIRCSPLLFADVTTWPNPDEDTARAFQLGSLYGGRDGQFPVFSRQRWDCWKVRLSELTSAAEELQLSGESLARIQLALEAMAKAETEAVDK